MEHLITGMIYFEKCTNVTIKNTILNVKYVTLYKTKPSEVTFINCTFPQNTKLKIIFFKLFWFIPLYYTKKIKQQNETN